MDLSRGVALLGVKAFLLNYASLFGLLFLTVDSLYASWWEGPLYARILLNLFYNTHALSIMAVVVSGWFMWLYRKDSLAVAVFAAFGIASIHELVLDAVDILVYGIPSGISIPYAAYLFAFLGLGFFVTKRYHKEVWLAAAAIMFVWFFVLTALPHYSTISPACDFCPSKDFYNPVANLEEVASWLVPASLWFLPRRWFQPQKSPP